MVEPWIGFISFLLLVIDCCDVESSLLDQRNWMRNIQRRSMVYTSFQSLLTLNLLEDLIVWKLHQTWLYNLFENVYVVLFCAQTNALGYISFNILFIFSFNTLSIKNIFVGVFFLFPCHYEKYESTFHFFPLLSSVDYIFIIKYESIQVHQ